MQRQRQLSSPHALPSPRIREQPQCQLIRFTLPLQATIDDNKVDNKNPTSSSTPQTAAATTNTEYSFFDEAIIFVRGGPGGQGASTHRKGVGGQNGPPDGGNGGRGGNVILVVDASLNTLAGLNPSAWRPNAFGGSGAAVSGRDNNNPNSQWISTKTFRAERGADGERQMRSGKYGQHVRVRLPPGTVVQEQITRADGSVFYKDLGSVTLENPTMVVAQGGEGGEGSGVGGKGRGVRRKRISQEGGEKKTIKLTLKIVADVALVGTPNAGKSTLLAAVTRAKPKIANYPFTTVIPNLGVWIPPESDYREDSSGGGKGRRQTDGAGSEGLALCDVPGLIEGAADGIGLGHAFLRHIERCHVILHLVDPTADDPIGNFHMINQEITKYGTGQLAQMPQVVVVNKADVFDEEELGEGEFLPTLSKEDIEKELRAAMSHTRLMWMSAKEKDGLDDLMIRLEMFVKKVKQATSGGNEEESD